MESFPLFFKIRASTFMCVMLFSFLWLVLLCVEMFARWSVSDEISHSLMILFVLTNTITLIMLPMLILVSFRAWLDAARLLLLLVIQVGSAAAGTYWGPKIQCPDQTPDETGVCQLINVYTMMACWIIPAILLSYSTYFVVVVYLQSRIPVVVEPRPHKHRSGDLEMGSTDTLSLWREKLKGIVGDPNSNTDGSIPSRSLVLPTMVHARQLSLPPSFASQHQADMPCRQSTMPSLPHNNQRPSLSHPPVPNRHYSLPAFKHSDRPLFPLSISAPSATSVFHPQTPSSYSYSTPSSANPQSQSFSSRSSAADPQSSKGSSRHLSMMPLSSPSIEMQSTRGSDPRRAKLSKPLPAHLL